MVIKRLNSSASPQKSNRAFHQKRGSADKPLTVDDPCERLARLEKRVEELHYKLDRILHRLGDGDAPDPRQYHNLEVRAEAAVDKFLEKQARKC